jgi:signal transduction histidine kinase
VEQVLRFARAESGQGLGAKERVSVESLVLDAVAASKGFLDNSACRVDTHVEPETPEVIVDAASMRHALQNLLSNAAKYAASGGWIGVNARVTHDGEEEVEIRVEDHGPGIPREELAHLFEPFYRGSKAMEEQIHGTGLGLSLVARIVEANGGTVEAESEPGNGARFTIRLPGAPRMNGNESTPD